jgi:hypothetical protein
LSLARHLCLLWLMVGLAPALRAEDAKKPVTDSAAKSAPAATTEDEVDEDFLEFLGSLDADDADEEWMDYLARTDIVKVAKAKKQTPAATEDKK